MACALLCVSWVLGSAASFAEPQDLLSASDRELLSELGSGVIGKPIKPPSDKEVAAAMARSRTARFRMVAGSHAGEIIEVTTEPATQLPDGSDVQKPTWQLKIPHVMTQYVVLDDTGLTAPALLLRRAGLFSEYEPIEPLIIFGLKPGEQKTYQAKVSARHVSTPKKVAYAGEVQITYRNLGGYEVKTPAGTFPGLIIRCDYVGKIGPAKMNDSVIRIYAPGEGMIASAGHDRFNAFMILSKNIVNAYILEGN